MRKTIVFFAACFAMSFTSKAQCDKNIKWNASKSEFIDTASGSIERTNNETVELTASSKTVSIVLKGTHAESMHGDVQDYVCQWQDKQNGKLSFRSALLDSQGKTRHAVITIESIDGKITALLKAEEEPTIIKLTIDSFDEVN